MTEGQFRALLVEEFGQDWVFSYFDPGGFTGGDHPILYPWSMVAYDKFRREAKKFLAQHGVKIGPPICEHLKPKMGRAA